MIENIPEDVWEKFKGNLNKNTTINDALIALIKERAEDRDYWYRKFRKEAKKG